MEAAMTRYVKLNDWIGRICLFVSCCGVAFTIAALTLAAVERHFIGFGYAMLNDLPPLLMPWVVLPLSGLLFRRNQHITVDFLPHMLTHRNRLRLDLVVAVTVLALAVWILLGGIEALGFFRMLNQTTETGVRFPVWWIYLSFPVGFGLLAWFALERSVVVITELVTGRSFAATAEGDTA